MPPAGRLEGQEGMEGEPRLAVTVSVVIPAFNAAQTIGATLDAIAGQSLMPQEVFVVDDGSSDNTRGVVEARHGQLPGRLIYLSQPHRGTGAARNLGWQSATGSIIAFTDADTVPTANWLSEAVRPFAHPDVAGVEGRVLALGTSAPTLYTHKVQNVSGGRFLTANVLYRREVLEAVGGFRLKHREDSDLAFSVLDRGLQIVFAPEAVVYHPPRPESLRFYFRIAERRRYEGALFRDHPLTAGRYLHKLQPTEILVVLAELAVLAGLVWFTAAPTILGLALLVVALPRRVAALLDGRQFAYREYLLAVGLSLALVPVEGYYHISGLVRPVPALKP